MVDVKYIREHLDEMRDNSSRRGLNIDFEKIIELDEARRALLSQVEKFRADINAVSVGGRPSDSEIERVREVKDLLRQDEENLTRVSAELGQALNLIPNILALDTPDGRGEEDNVEIYSWGKKPQFDFAPLDHIELGRRLDILDLERGAKVAGYRGYYLKNEGVKLALGLMMLALNKLIQRGFTPMIPPTLVKSFALSGSGYFKSGEYNPETDEIYQVASGDKEVDGTSSKDKKFLVGTAEPSLLAYYSGETLRGEQLPVKLCGFSQCYRSEIGSYGKDTKGIYRVHEFMKVEQVALVEADVELSDKMHQEMLEISKELHEELGLPYRVLRICVGDLSIGKYKQFDIEAWMPGLGRYGETGSASNFLDWQSGRLGVKYEKEGAKKNVYMINNTALPTPRTTIAILENFQTKDGSVKLPEALLPYTGFSEILPK